MESTRMVLTLGLLLTGLSVPGLAQEEEEPRQRMIEQGSDLAGERNELLEQLEASGERLDELLAVMNSAEDSARTEAMAEVLTELVSERQILVDATVQLQPRMMRHVMEHMGMGMEAMSMCPMMQSLGTEATAIGEPVGAGTGDEDHEEHH